SPNMTKNQLHRCMHYGAGQDARGWFCLDFQTGSQIWHTDMAHKWERITYLCGSNAVLPE
ncbi:MAG: hypothetical protein KAT15_09695, partial [Bacteroidales bacterium]|nr:hypothetical protein [Bacteroidales bacterium]